MDRQHAVTFANAAGQKLFGILHEPLGAARRDVGIILLSPGVKNRVAPHRMYNKMAAEFVALGFWVLRFDFYGLGDSEGEIREPLLADLYRSIQSGRYVADTHAAMDWMRRAYGVQQFVLGGLCGGAITGLLAGINRSDLAGILALGIPVILDGSRVDARQHMTAGQLNKVKRGYLRKLLKPSAWLRLLTFKTDFRMLFKALRTKRGEPAQPAGAGRAPAGNAPAGNANPHFPPAFLSVLAARRPILLVFSGSDRLYAEYREKFLTLHGDQVAVHAAQLEVEVIEDANHVFTFVEWQQEMLQRTRAWLQRRFPLPAEAVSALPTVSRESLLIH